MVRTRRLEFLIISLSIESCREPLKHKIFRVHDVTNIIRKMCEANKTRHVINRPSFRGRTALITAAMHNHLGICKALYDKGADLDFQDDDKFTALIYASRQGYGLVVRWLVEHGANVNLRNSNGKSALTIAEENGRDKIAYYLHRCRGIIKSPNIKESVP